MIVFFIFIKKIVNFLYEDATIYLDRKYDIVKSILTKVTVNKKG